MPEDLRAKIAAAFADRPGVTLEDKITTFAVHYRQAPDQGEAIKKILSRLVQEAGSGITLIPGRKVYEAAAAMHNKGQAVERLLTVAPFKDRRPVFLGDDITDISAIGACLRRGGLAARVGKGGEADGKSAFPGPERVRAWINNLGFETDG